MSDESKIEGIGNEAGGGENLSFDQIESLLRFDHFAEGGEEEGSDQTASDGGDDVSEPEKEVPAEPEGEEEVEPEGETEEEAAAPQESSEVRELRAQLQAERERVDKILKERGGSKEETPPQEGPDFDFQIPDELVQLLESEDAAERRQGYAALARGVAMETYRRAVEQHQKVVSEQVLPEVRNQILRHAQAQEVYKQFYGTHVDLDRQELRPVVLSIAQEVFATKGYKSWSKQASNEIAKTVRQRLGLPQPQAKQPGRKTPAPVPQGKRPAADPAGVSSEIRDLLF